MAQAESRRFYDIFRLSPRSPVPGEGAGVVSGMQQQSIPLEPLPVDPGSEAVVMGLPEVPIDGSPIDAMSGSGSEDRSSLIETWKNLQRRKATYSSGVYEDGTPFGPGERLIVIREGTEIVEGRPRRIRVPEQVMDDFERPWCDVTVSKMFEGKDGPLTVLERGFGLGLMAERINWQMRSRGGKHIVVELNREIYEDALKWAERMRREMPDRRLSRPVEIEVIHDDADAAIQRFPHGYFDLIFSDTHQLREEERGINDLLALEELKDHLKPDGRFTFCAFHRDNQTGDLDPRQRMLITPHFRGGYRAIPVELTPPPDCTYLLGPKKIVPAVVCYEPRLSTRAA